MKTSTLRLFAALAVLGALPWLSGCGTGKAEAQNGGPSAKTFVVPHVFDTSGGVADGTNFSYDTFVFLTHNGGIANVAGDGDVTATVFLFDDATGQPVGGATLPGGACTSCTATLTPQNRKARIPVDDILTEAGIFPTATNFIGFAMIRLDGEADDLAHVGVQVFIERACITQNGSPFDVSVLGYIPQEITAVN